jgi:hypothetical protein
MKIIRMIMNEMVMRVMKMIVKIIMIKVIGIVIVIIKFINVIVGHGERVTANLLMLIILNIIYNIYIYISI